MKKLLLLLFTVLLFSCAKEITNNAIYEPGKMVNLLPNTGVKLRSLVDDSTHLSAVEIVKQAMNLTYYNESMGTSSPWRVGFQSDQRDTITPKFMLYGGEVITQEGTLVTELISGTDMVFERLFIYSYVTGKRTLVNPFTRLPSCHENEIEVLDTVGYIQNSILRPAEVAIKVAFAAGDYKQCYALTDSVFKFTPITGEEWRKLKEQGLE